MKQQHANRVRHALKHHFIPHAGNNYHPHVLHTKWSLVYGGLLIGLKIVVVIYAVFLPMQAFVAPNVLNAQRSRILALTNDLRAEKHLSTLALVPPLERSAQDKADDMAERKYFSHQGPGGHGLGYFLSRSGYKYSLAGENLAMGFSDAESLVDAWIRSPTHYANLVDPAFKQFGLGIEEGEYEGKPTVFVAQHFGVPLESKAPEAPVDSVPPVTAPAVVKPPEKPVASVPAKTTVAVKPPAPVKPVKVTPSLPVTTAPPVQTPTPPIETPAPAVEAPVPVVESPGEVVAVVPSQQASSTSSVSVPIAGDVSLQLATASSALTYIPEQSGVRWTDLPDGRTRVEMQVVTTGEVSQAHASIEGYPVDLTKDEATSGTYRGGITIAESSDVLFRTVIAPSVTFIDREGKMVRGAVEWEHPKVVSPTPWQKYLQASQWFSVMPLSIFTLSHGMYSVFLAFFLLMLFVSILIELRKRRPHVVMRAMSLAVLAFFLWKI